MEIRFFNLQIFCFLFFINESPLYPSLLIKQSNFLWLVTLIEAPVNNLMPLAAFPMFPLFPSSSPSTYFCIGMSVTLSFFCYWSLEIITKERYFVAFRVVKRQRWEFGGFGTAMTVFKKNFPLSSELFKIYFKKLLQI